MVKAGYILLLATIIFATMTLIAIDEIPAQNDWAQPIGNSLPPKSSHTPRSGPPSDNLFGILLSNLQEDLESIEGVVTEEFGESDIHYEDEPPIIVSLDGGSEIDMSGCENCGQQLSSRCLRCRTGGRIIGGNGAYFLRPMWQNNPAFAVGNGPDLATSNTFIGRDFDWGTVVAPYAWLGVQGSSGLGIRGRFLWFDDDSTVSYVVPAGNNVVSPEISGQLASWDPLSKISAQHQIKFHVTDVEFSYAKDYNNWGLEAAGGVRYVDFNQFYVIHGRDNAGRFQTFNSAHSFKGLGPTVLVKGQHALGGPLGVFAFASARESILFGDGDSTVRGNTNQFGSTFQQEFSKAVIAVSEFEVGFRRVFVLRRITSEVELAFVGQLWNGVGNGSNGGIFSSQSDQTMGLVGGRASMGFSF